MTALDLASFAAAIASLVLAVVAIVLSILFYKMSAQLAEGTREAAKGIGASVEKLEKLFDRLYADTFSMMKETVSDMRKHAWGESPAEGPTILDEAEKKADEKIEALRRRIETQVGKILEGQQITDGRVKEVTNKLRGLVDKAIEDSRNVEHEAREETIRGHILRQVRMLRPRKHKATAEDVVDRLAGQFPIEAIIAELRRMRRENILAHEGEPDSVSPETELIIS